MRALVAIYAFFLLPLAGLCQAQVFGSWQGKMSTPNGNYYFNLDLRPNRTGGGNLKGTAIHNRNGETVVIELEGYFYGDQSIYLADVGDPFRKLQEGNTFSRLQFICTFEGGELVLNGHWQEYQDMSKFRRGRLVLFRKKTKA
jgi:hypothetical protein